MSGKIYAYAGKILRVNLSTGSVTTEPTTKYASRFLGGRGINSWILYNEVKPLIWPFDPANRLIFGTGVLVGTPVPTACRYTLTGKNAFTGGVGSSNSGGHFAPEVKFAGYDHIVIQGRSRKPCYLWIEDENIEIRDADNLWGRTTWETDNLIRETLRDEDIQVASIGPAGENLVRAACVITNGERAAGRCGLGAVMGSKNLKAVAVRGSSGISIARPDEFMRLVEDMWDRVETNDVMRTFRQRGTTFYLEDLNQWSGNVVRNFQDGFWDAEKIKKTSAETLRSKYAVRKLACFACPVACSTYLRITEGEFEGTEGEGFKCNTLMNFGPRVDNDDLTAIIKAHTLCSQYGLDVDNTACVIAWAMECFENGIFTEHDTDGFKLEWGNYGAVLELVRKIALREGFGDLLAEGSKRASQIVGKGSEKYSITIKGQELYEPIRAAGKGWGFGVIVANRGGGHLNGAPITEHISLGVEDGSKLFGVPTAGDRTTCEGKAKLVVWFEKFKAAVDCLNICYFSTLWTSPDLPGPNDLARLIAVATGRDITGAEFMEIGSRIENVEKAFNVRQGMRRRDDYPPKRIFEPIASGPGRGERLKKDEFEMMLDEYYLLKGWDIKTGFPTKENLEKMELKEIAKELEARDVFL